MKQIILLIALMLPSIAFCITWQDLWFTQNQQAARLLKQNKLAQAAEKFSDPLWQGYANYKTGAFQKALHDFSEVNSPLANFNRGNTLTQLGQYQAAIAAYNTAIQQQADFSDAIYNKKIVEKLLQQQQSKNKNQTQNQSKNQSDKNKQNNPSPNKQPHQSAQNKNKQNNNSQQQKNNANNLSNNQAANSSQTNLSSSPKLNTPQEQALKQWLQQIPDNPGDLLRQKFLRDHLELEAEKSG